MSLCCGWFSWLVNSVVFIYLLMLYVIDSIWCSGNLWFGGLLLIVFVDSV